MTSQPPKFDPTQPPANLPLDPRIFYSTPMPTKAMALTPQPETVHILEQLGPPNFRKSGFPVIGFLAGLYEHVAAHVSSSS